MHWVIQENIYRETGYADLIQVLERNQIPFSLHKVVPFIGELEPDINPTNPVIVIGSYSMRHLAKKKGWIPGCFDLFDINFLIQRDHWGDLLLNHDARVLKFGEIKREISDEDEVFLRPIDDSKAFAGMMIDWPELITWQKRVSELPPENGSDLRSDTTVMVANPKVIHREYRLWVVSGQIVTSCSYKTGNRVIYDPVVDGHILEFGDECISRWNPAPALVLDVCETPDGLRIVEINTINSAGFYAANIGKLVIELEDLGNR